MSLEAPEDPWKSKKISMTFHGSMLQLSQVWVVLFVVVNAGLLGWLGFNWTVNSWKLADQDSRLGSLGDDVDWLQERTEWGASYVRIQKALVEAGNGHFSKKQLGKLQESLWTQSRTYGFDPLLVVAVMQVESKSTPWARGHFQSGEESGALGLMQLKLETAQIMGRALGLDIQTESDLMKPEVNMVLGTYYLLRLIVRYGDVGKGLMAYNIGPYALDARLRNGTRLPESYARRILIEYRRLTEKFGSDVYLGFGFQHLVGT